MKVKTLSYLISTLLLTLLPNFVDKADHQPLNDQDLVDCRWKEFPLHGKVQIVDAFPDIKVQIVDAFPDLKVKYVNAFPDECGEWQIVDAFPDIKVQFVESFPDIKIKIVEHFPGMD